MDPDRLIWQMDAAMVAQLIHADLAQHGIACQWATWYEPSQDLIDEFERIAETNVEELFQ